MQQIKGCEFQSTANIKVLDVKRVGDLNWFWSWAVNRGTAKQAKTEKEFYEDLFKRLDQNDYIIRRKKCIILATYPFCVKF